MIVSAWCGAWPPPPSEAARGVKGTHRRTSMIMAIMRLITTPFSKDLFLSVAALE
jgi:hypothetical protein